MTVVGPTPVFEVPWWLGGYVASVNESSNWTLPLTYPNGGRTNIGAALVVQNRGPENITLYAQGNETIQGLGSYLVVAYSTVQLLSDVDWIVVSTTFGTTSNDGNFAYLQAQNESVQCWLSVGTDSPINQQCGDFTVDGFVQVNSSRTQKEAMIVTKNFTETTNLGTDSGVSIYVGLNTNPATSTRGIRGLNAEARITNNGTIIPGNIYSAVTGIRSAVVHAAPGIRTTALTSFSTAATMESDAIASNVYGIFIGGMSAAASARADAYWGIRMNAPSSVNITDYNGASFPGSSTHSGLGRTLIVGECTGGTTNYGILLNSNTAGCGAGLVAGTAGDVCLYRATAGVWTFNAGASLRVPQYLTTGLNAVPSNTAAGAFSTTKASPALQAFGAVTANAASGVLAFTVSTAAQSCSAALITNTNVAASSEVILTIQSYTGTRYTNGVPIVSRSDTSGSSSGSFTLQLCNDHATNALSGNLFIAFWVLN